jgi:hypothetical protein
MRRNLLSIMPLTVLAAALLPAGSLWAAANTSNPAAQHLNQINEQTYQIQAQADRLEAYVRSGSHDSTRLRLAPAPPTIRACK